MTYQPAKKIKLTPKQKRQIEQAADFEFVRALLRDFPKSNVYVVGGTVRDALMDRADTKDYDLVAAGIPAKKLASYLGRFGTLNLVGRNFGVYKFLPTGWDFKNPMDIALPRREYALGTGGYRDFEVQSDPALPIEADLARRDFTWNAMAYDIRNKILIDPWEGAADIKKGLVRTVGDPAERLKEDYSRLLRAIRFAARFNFEIEPLAKKTIHKLAPQLNNERAINGKKEYVAPRETLSAEFLKSLAADSVKTIKLYDELGILKALMPELLKMKNCEQPYAWHAEGDVWQHTMLTLENLKKPMYLKKFNLKTPGTELILAVLFHDIGKPRKAKNITENGKKRLVFYEHDEEGAKIFRRIAERMKFAASPDFTVKIERVEWLICNHLLSWNNDPYKMRETTLEKYFFNPKFSGDDLLALSFADAMATKPNGKNADMRNLKRFFKKIREMKKMAAGKKILPPPILDGNDIMRILEMVPGPRVGEILNLLREEQLSGRIKDKKTAEQWLKKL
jgi:putative nucleotidyltransferase with HDIG domain